jgi:hypothetical protein
MGRVAAKDADLLAHDYHVLRLTRDRFLHEPDQEAARLHALLQMAPR